MCGLLSKQMGGVDSMNVLNTDDTDSDECLMYEYESDSPMRCYYCNGLWSGTNTYTVYSYAHQISFERPMVTGITVISTDMEGSTSVFNTDALSPTSVPVAPVTGCGDDFEVQMGTAG